MGGPDSNLIVVITSFGISACAGADYSYSVAIQDSQDFLAGVIEEYGIKIP